MRFRSYSPTESHRFRLWAIRWNGAFCPYSRDMVTAVDRGRKANGRLVAPLPPSKFYIVDLFAPIANNTMPFRIHHYSYSNDFAEIWDKRRNSKHQNNINRIDIMDLSKSNTYSNRHFFSVFQRLKLERKYKKLSDSSGNFDSELKIIDSQE